MKTKIIALLLAMVVMVGALASCGIGGGSTNNGGSTNDGGSTGGNPRPCTWEEVLAVYKTAFGK